MAPAASSSATGLCTLVKGLNIKLKHYYLRILWRKKLGWHKIFCKTASFICRGSRADCQVSIQCGVVDSCSTFCLFMNKC